MCLCKKRQQNTFYPQGGRISESNFFKLNSYINSQPIIEGISLICGRWDKHSMHRNNTRNIILFAKSATFGGKEFFAAIVHVYV